MADTFPENVPIVVFIFAMVGLFFIFILSNLRISYNSNDNYVTDHKTYYLHLYKNYLSTFRRLEERHGNISKLVLQNNDYRQHLPAELLKIIINLEIYDNYKETCKIHIRKLKISIDHDDEINDLEGWINCHAANIHNLTVHKDKLASQIETLEKWAAETKKMLIKEQEEIEQAFIKLKTEVQDVDKIYKDELEKVKEFL